MLRYSKLNDAQILKRLMEICKEENIKYLNDGIEAIIFTAQGDMRQAINNLQSTTFGFGMVNSENVFKVCDEPHPLLVKDMIASCTKGDLDGAYNVLNHLCHLGYTSQDIISVTMRVTKTFEMTEFMQLEFIREIGLTCMRISQGCDSQLQLSAMLARLCEKGISHIAIK
ncbi:unnamed protein product [Didymodactylos carnosus]|uniref:Replication factor C C-terminal domain-containing protein n=2 Tax=Didymodactylos carnosus TaxID=1234261 RepID=A0A8S2FYP4_9BILA|nr:unnamed protein product [Didymodactylos carnosus]CAF4389845.1 unnamed protein product [Didymodactylos carnosus]